MLPAIDAIEVVEARVSRRPHNRVPTTYGTVQDGHFALVLVRAGDLTGIGEAPTDHWWTGEDAATVRHAVERYLAPALVGFTGGIRTAAARMDRALGAHQYAKAAVEMALWDLLGKFAGLPLHVLLGGGPARPVPIKYVIGAVDPAHAREELDFGRELGFTFFKVKVGGELEADLRRVEAVAAALGDGERVGVDANTGWSPVTAAAALEPLEELGVAFLEQPVSQLYPETLAELAAATAIPLVAHESIFTVSDGVRAAAGRLADVWALTPGTHGGILPTLDLLALARSHGIPCLLGSTFELGIASAMMAHVGSAFDEIALSPIPSDVIGPLYYEHDVVAAGPRIEGGFVHVPDGPGLGVELDPEALS